MKYLIATTFLTTSLVLLTACVSPEQAAPENAPSHHTGNGFRNLFIEDKKDKNLFAFFRMKYFGDQPFADHEAEAPNMPIAEHAVDQMRATEEKPKVTWIGHSTFLVQYKGINILTDPVLSDRTSPVSFAGPKRLVDKPIQQKDLPPIDYVVISHNHYDHLDEKTIKALGDRPMYLVPLKLKPWFIENGISAEQVVEFDWWDEHHFEGLRVVATPSQHWSGRSLTDRYQTLWAAWRFDLADFSLWFGGDTGYNDQQFRETGERLGPVDLALIPIGAYAPRWFMKASHINPEEAVLIHNEIGSAFSIGMHWGTFQLTAEPFFEPEQRLQKAVDAGKLTQGSFVTLAIGESVEVDARH